MLGGFEHPNWVLREQQHFCDRRWQADRLRLGQRGRTVFRVVSFLRSRCCGLSSWGGSSVAVADLEAVAALAGSEDCPQRGEAVRNAVMHLE
jgi:hypothetical protein